MQSLMREAQVAMLGAFDRTDTVTAAQLHAAAAGFSEKTENRGRAELTREGVLIRSKRGMEGEVTYTISRAASLPGKYCSRPFLKKNQERQRTVDNAPAALLAAEYDDDYDGAADLDNDEGARTAGSAWGWIVPISICICGLVAIGFMRRRLGAFPIGKLEPFPGAFDFVPESDA